MRRLSLVFAVALLLAASVPFRVRRPLLIFNSFTPLDLAVLASPFVVLAIAVARGGRLAIGDRGVATILSLPVVLGIISLLWSRDLPATLYYCVQSSLALATYLAAVMLLAGQSHRTILRLTAAFVSVAVLISVLSFARVPGLEPEILAVPGSPEATTYVFAYYSRLSHPYWGLSNNLASVLAFFPILLLGVAADVRRRWPAVVAVIATLGVFATLSRSTALALVVGTIVFVVADRGARRLVAGASAALTVIGAGVVVALLPLLLQLQALLVDRLTTESVGARTEKIRVAIEKIQAAPILGYGAGVVPDGTPALIGGSHVTYLESMLYYGLPIGMAFNLALLALPLVLLRRRRALPGSSVPAAAACSLLVMLAVFASQATFEGAVLRILFYLSVALAVTLLNATPSGERAHAA